MNGFGSVDKATVAVLPRWLAAVFGLMLGLVLLQPLQAQDKTGPRPTDGPWAASQVLTVQQLAAQLKAGEKPAILQVGFHVLYEAAHIPGSVYCGPASRPDSVKTLRETAAKLPRDREVVLYCGCCPWQKCPNIRPAFDALKGMGFHKLKVLYIPDNFARDWVQQHLPTSQVK